MTGFISGDRSASGQGWHAGERKRAPSSSRGIEQQNPRGKNRSKPKKKKERSRSSNWNDEETTALINCMKEGGRFRKGKNTDWVATCEEIENVSGSTRTKKQCQRRSDTLTKAHKVLKRRLGVNYKQYFESTEKERSENLSTRLTQVWYEDLEQIEQQQQQKPGHLSSSNSGGSPSLSGTQTPSRSALSEDAGSSGTDLISSLQSSPSPDRTHFQDPAVLYQTHNSESTDLVWAQGPATPNRTDIAQVVQAEDPDLRDGEDSVADYLTLESIDKALQESQDCYYFRTHFCTYGWIPPWELNNVESQSSWI